MSAVQWDEERERRRRLNAMKQRATGLLAAAAGVFVVARVFESTHPWLGLVRATSEAALVGGLADWFAVTALFRHPLGLPIPHTAVIARRKDRFGQTLGRFVEQNFLSREVVGAKLRSMGLARRGAQWIREPANSRTIARHVAAALAGAARVLRDEDVRELLDRSVVARIRQIQVAPLLGNLLSMLTAGKRQDLLNEIVELVGRLVAENEDIIRERIHQESPWWVPVAVNRRIHRKIVDAIDNTLQEVSTDPEHPLRDRFDAAVQNFIDRLKTSPELIGRAEALKEEVLSHPTVRQFSASLWGDVKRSLLRYAEAPSEGAPTGVERGLNALGAAVLADPVLLEKIDSWIVDAILYAVEQYQHEVGQIIAQTVSAWDAEATSRKIELNIGRDLQFIRINGTIVGGLAGLAIHVISTWLL